MENEKQINKEIPLLNGAEINPRTFRKSKASSKRG